MKTTLKIILLLMPLTSSCLIKRRSRHTHTLARALCRTDDLKKLEDSHCTYPQRVILPWFGDNSGRAGRAHEPYPVVNSLIGVPLRHAWTQLLAGKLFENGEGRLLVLVPVKISQ